MTTKDDRPIIKVSRHMYRGNKMGMYTELVIKCQIDLKKISGIEFRVLNFLFGNGKRPEHLPDHEFFKCERWHMIGKCASYYHIPMVCNCFEDNYLFSRSDLKNQGHEIEKFIDWLGPLIDEEDGQCIGWRWYEELEKPILLFK